MKNQKSKLDHLKSKSTKPKSSSCLAKRGLKLILPKGNEIEIKPGVYVGRDLLAEPFLKIDQKIDLMLISRNHFIIREDANRLYIEDEMSLNGTRLNGKEITGLGPFAIYDGDKILIPQLEQCKMVFKAQAEQGVKIIAVEPTEKVFIGNMDVRLRILVHNYETEDKVIRLKTNAPGFEKDKYESAWIKIRPGMDLEDSKVLIGRPLKKEALELDVHLIDREEMHLDSASFKVKIHESWKDKLGKTGRYALKLMPIIMSA